MQQPLVLLSLFWHCLYLLGVDEAIKRSMSILDQYTVLVRRRHKLVFAWRRLTAHASKLPEPPVESLEHPGQW